MHLFLGDLKIALLPAVDELYHSDVGWQGRRLKDQEWRQEVTFEGKSTDEGNIKLLNAAKRVEEARAEDGNYPETE